ncbi:MAG TPA: hypothetical protein VKE40_26855 [Gemmataceae bacterium]|nr:hypothetical protein [Gemmataceae bacterium]
MPRTLVGIGLGASFGFVTGYIVALVIEPRRSDPFLSLLMGTLLAASGAATGAVVGGVKDLLTYMRVARLSPQLTGPEADYRELPPPANPPDRSP